MTDNPETPLVRIGLLLSFIGGYVDTAGFLSLQGLFTAHVTGNFVTLGASLVHGTSGGLAKLLALPVFCILVIAARWMATARASAPGATFRLLIGLELALLVMGALLSGVLGPFHDGDAVGAFWTGMALVAAMALQNAAGRMYLAKLPPSTLMTGTTTQVMLDVADLLRGAPGEQRQAALGRLRRMLPALLVFAVGCAAGAGLFATLRQWCFVLAPLAVLVMWPTLRKAAIPAAA